MKNNAYLCNVFFIVLDLRLTGIQRGPIFCASWYVGDGLAERLAFYYCLKGG